VPLPDPGSGQSQYQFELYFNYPDFFHNGVYEVTMYYQYTVFTYNPYPMGTTYYGSATAQFEMDNLLITNVAVVGGDGADYILWDPDTMTQPPPINFNLTDTQNGTAWVKLGIYDSSQNWVTGKVITVPRPTTGASIAWDGKDAQGNLMPKGIYLFTLKTHAEGPNFIPVYAADVYRSGQWGNVNSVPELPDEESPWLRIAQTSVQVIGYNQTTGVTTVRVGYVMTELRTVPASSAWVEIYDPDVQLVTSKAGGTTVNDPNAAPTTWVWNYVDIDLSIDKLGTYIFLVSANDGEAIIDKGHRQRPALQHNVRLDNPQKVVVLDPGHGRYRIPIQGGWATQTLQNPNNPNDTITTQAFWRRSPFPTTDLCPDGWKFHEDDSNLALAWATEYAFLFAHDTGVMVYKTRSKVWDLYPLPNFNKANRLRVEYAVSIYNRLKKRGVTPHMVFVAIHTNSDGPTAHGTETIYHPPANPRSQYLAQDIFDHLRAGGVEKHRDPYAMSLTVFGVYSSKHPIIPALVEVVFHSNSVAIGTYGPEEKWLYDGVIITIWPDGDGEVTVWPPSYWGNQIAGPAIYAAIHDYFAAYSSPP